MQIADNSVVSFHYTLSNTSGEELESNRNEHPTSYLHGAGNIIRGLEKAFEGHSAGDHFEVTLAPSDAYGVRNEELTQRIPVKHLVCEGKLKVGAIAQVNTEQGKRTVTVIKLGRHSATIDGNHPLAGQELVFSVDIADVREASSEEVAHGHAHGVGGHEH